MQYFGSVSSPLWQDKKVFLVGGGPSLRGFDFQRLAAWPRQIVVGINQSIWDAPCDVGVSMDYLFCQRNHDRLAQFAQDHELYLAVGNRWYEHMARIPGAIYLKNFEREGLSLDPEYVCRGGTSGYAALNVAVLKLSGVIVLLGYDYGAAGTGRHHYHDAYPWMRANAENWKAWAEHYKHAAEVCAQQGIVVVNASEKSALSCFNKCSLETMLSEGRSLSRECRGLGTISCNGHSFDNG